MPLLGDAIIGLTAPVVAYIVWKMRGQWVWTTLVVWNAVAIWDALSAYVIHRTNQWDEFFMIKALGPSMFFGASAMHLVAIGLVCQPELRRWFLDGHSSRTTAKESHL